MTNKNTRELAQFAEVALLELHADHTEKQAGFCLRVVRQLFSAAFGANAWPVPRGYDAAQALGWFEANGYVLEEGNAGSPGCIYFWVGDGHGLHGHVAIRVKGNQMAENYSPNAGGYDRDARGLRPMTPRNRPTHVVRYVPSLEKGGVL